MEFLRDVHDETGVPMVLLCTKDLVDRIRRDADVDHGQLYSRIARVVDVTRGYDKRPGGKRPLFTISEIRALYESDKVRLHPDAQAFLQDVANEIGFGSLRRCKSILAWAVMIERATQELERDAPILVTGALLVRAERDSFSDQAMIADIEARTVGVAKTA